MLTKAYYIQSIIVTCLTRQQGDQNFFPTHGLGLKRGCKRDTRTRTHRAELTASHLLS